MPIVNFNYLKQYALINNNGLIQTVPALPSSSRLYVIYNNSTNRPYYIGTAVSLKNRFSPRLEVIREMGFDQNCLDEILIFEIQIEVDGKFRTPGDDGIAGGIDVEHLLIRTYINSLNENVRNIQKVTPFINNTGTLLSWNLLNSAGNIPGFGGPYNFNLAASACL